ncbi:MAG: hypothetical protein IPG76_24775 [Acidobacteria bacterium]|nr:hypothetical protein [Acidobacteriota bacterium]
MNLSTRAIAAHAASTPRLKLEISNSRSGVRQGLGYPIANFTGSRL